MPDLDAPIWILLAHGLTLLLAVASLVATLLPLLRETAWWIRVFDFPRLQIVTITLLTLGGALLLGWHQLEGYWGLGLVGALGAAVVYQSFRIVPYTPVASKQIGDSTQTDGKRHLSLAVMNVLQYNKQGARALAVLQQTDPDLIMAVETDAWWYEQLKPLEATHPYTCHEPLDNTYGLLFFSRLPLEDCEIKYLLDDDVPSLHGRVQLPDGKTWVRLYGLHPKPPAPAESKTSTKRDAELLLVGKEIDRKDEPTIVFGDMNDVAWSHTSELFRRISGLLDPRVGRGLLPTFHADYMLLRWPLDHVFVSPDFKVDDIQRLPYVGSDHFPIYLKLSYEPQAKVEQEENCEQADIEDFEEAEQKIQEGFEEEDEEEEQEDTGRKPQRELTT
ncbi:endonuclease/exonuclease/phosphatase family protein [Hymenobacter chitinivorans]|uniref:Endonuclease/exonuclease/phosphatase (EEP) superfamily protein YafD n=1 Tax=Hymenobacter chitinivorans DSM 11115 TaxID=1121954 RepID=A0A2M9BMQ1_9BACT|nr:endonuclease/exonuclease/phosphatase family protein [Hymenobacter chitinivorans]PJJ59228.1 endonuclease/exonuclease/phosphatase (EEP) superfamily protein YafD [Hymenobacter chitinivorans DSM 11115]